MTTCESSGGTVLWYPTSAKGNDVNSLHVKQGKWDHYPRAKGQRKRTYSEHPSVWLAKGFSPICQSEGWNANFLQRNLSPASKLTSPPFIPPNQTAASEPQGSAKSPFLLSQPNSFSEPLVLLVFKFLSLPLPSFFPSSPFSLSPSLSCPFLPSLLFSLSFLSPSFSLFLDPLLLVLSLSHLFLVSPLAFAFSFLSFLIFFLSFFTSFFYLLGKKKNPVTKSG